jgi:uncharacterized protein YhaN
MPRLRQEWREQMWKCWVQLRSPDKWRRPAQATPSRARSTLPEASAGLPTCPPVERSPVELVRENEALRQELAALRRLLIQAGPVLRLEAALAAASPPGREIDETLEAKQAALTATQEELQVTNEELQVANEELLAANAELQATNRELQRLMAELAEVEGALWCRVQEQHHERGRLPSALMPKALVARAGREKESAHGPTGCPGTKPALPRAASAVSEKAPLGDCLASPLRAIAGDLWRAGPAVPAASPEDPS